MTAFWLVPELGTDQVFAVGAVTLLAAALVVALAVRLVPAALALSAALVGAIALTVMVAPDQQQLGGVAAQNWSPLYRQREARTPGPLDPASIGALGEQFTVREARDTRYHRMVVADDSESRYLRFDNSFQSGMWLDDPNRTRFRYTDYLTIGLAHRPAAKDVLFIGLGGGSAPKRMFRDFPRLAAAGRRARSGRRGRCVPLVRAAPRPPPRRRCRRRTPLARAERQALGRDRARRVLRRLDSVPSGDQRVPAAGAQPARSRRGRRRERDRGARGRRVEAAPVTDEDVPLGVPDRAPLPGVRDGCGDEPDVHAERDPRRDRLCSALDGVPARALADGPEQRPDGPRSRSRDRRSLVAAGAVRRRARADRRLRADGRAPRRRNRVCGVS